MDDMRLALRDDDGFEVEFEIVPINPIPETDQERQEIHAHLNDLNAQIQAKNDKLDELNSEIDRLTNHADGLDYMVAVGSGVLTGMIDIFVVGEFNFTKAKGISNKSVNDFIMKYAKRKGYKGDRLDGAISSLERDYKVVNDNLWYQRGIKVNTQNHHLADLAHHPTLLGLAAAIASEFLQAGFFLDRDGNWTVEFLSEEAKEAIPQKLLKLCLPFLISGLFMWLINVVEAGYAEKMDDEIPESIRKIVRALASAPAAIQILKMAISAVKATNNWAGHLVSDMGGSKNTAGGGMGIPGLFISILQEIAGLPGIKNTEFPQIVNKLYVSNKIDMRAELAVVHELGRQAIPVLINEVLVRGFYFVRHLVEELKGQPKDLKRVNWNCVDWNRIVPIGNRTISRMITISSGTFMAADMADAAIRAAVKSIGVAAPVFMLHVNFVNIGRFAVALGTDISMGVKRERLRNERMKLYTEQIALCNARLFYLQADMWISAKQAGRAIEETYDVMEKSIVFYYQHMSDMQQILDEIGRMVPLIQEKNPGLLEDIYDEFFL